MALTVEVISSRLENGKRVVQLKGNQFPLLRGSRGSDLHNIRIEKAGDARTT
jgi:hypothetical protein